MLCPMPAERIEAAGTGFEPAILAFFCGGTNYHLRFSAYVGWTDWNPSHDLDQLGGRGLEVDTSALGGGVSWIRIPSVLFEMLKEVW